jgi:hypothetical protein
VVGTFASPWSATCAGGSEAHATPSRLAREMSGDGIAPRFAGGAPSRTAGCASRSSRSGGFPCISSAFSRRATPDPPDRPAPRGARSARRRRPGPVRARVRSRSHRRRRHQGRRRARSGPRPSPPRAHERTPLRQLERAERAARDRRSRSDIARAGWPAVTVASLQRLGDRRRRPGLTSARCAADPCVPCLPLPSAALRRATWPRTSGGSPPRPPRCIRTGRPGPASGWAAFPGWRGPPRRSFACSPSVP